LVLTNLAIPEQPLWPKLPGVVHDERVCIFSPSEEEGIDIFTGVFDHRKRRYH